jgi:hypothetical protein
MRNESDVVTGGSRKTFRRATRNGSARHGRIVRHPASLLGRGLGLCALFAALFSAGLPASAVKPGRWEFLDRASFGSSRVRGFEITNEGRLKPGFATNSIPVPADYVWSLLELNGALYVGTGDKARIFRVHPPIPPTASGAPIDTSGIELVWEGEGLEVYTMAKTDRGDILAGISPIGQVLRLRPAENGLKTIHAVSVPESYVWRLLAVGDDVWIATGSALPGTGGAIYRLRGNDLQLIHRADDPHVLCLERSGQTIYAGTQGPGGAVLEIAAIESAAPRVTVLFDPPQEEVVDLVASPEGDLYAMTSSSSGRGGGSSSIAARPSADEGDEEGEGEEAAPSSSPAPPAGGNVIYKIDRTGRAEPWIRARSNIRSMVWTRGALHVATTDQGQVFRVDGPAQSTLVLSLDEKSLLFISENFVGTGKPAVVHEVVRATQDASLRSEALDAGGLASWGVLTFEAKGAWEVRTRSGNSASPDATWSAWSLPIRTTNGRIESPTSRYLQYEVRYIGADPDDFFRQPALTYQVINRAPKITAVTVSRLNLDARGLASVGRAGPLGTLVQQVAQAAKNLATQAAASGGEYTMEELLQPFLGLTTIQWTTEDADNDKLTAKIEIADENGMQRVTVEKDFRGAAYLLNSRNFPDGRYRATITVSDARENNLGSGIETSRTSDVFLIDNHPPVVELRLDPIPAGGWLVLGSAKDELGRISALFFRDEEGKWQKILPDDGICDQPEEVFRIVRLRRETQSSPGLLVVKAVDQNGNVGYATIRY